MSLPEPVRRRLSSFSRTVFFDNNRTGPENRGDDNIAGEAPPLPPPHCANDKDGDGGGIVALATEWLGLELPGEREQEGERGRENGLVVWASAQNPDCFSLNAVRRHGDNEIVSGLPLQMSLYFNLWFFPFWWVSSVAMLQLKYPVLPDYYKFILVTIIILTSLIEIIRLYLGYMGNLQEKVPELAGFWLLSLLLQLPLILFVLLNEGLKIQPLERAVNVIFVAFLVFQVITAFLDLKKMVNQLATRFRLHEFDRLDDNFPSDNLARKKRKVEASWVVGPPVEEIRSASGGWGSAMRA